MRHASYSFIIFLSLLPFLGNGLVRQGIAALLSPERRPCCQDGHYCPLSEAPHVPTDSSNCHMQHKSKTAEPKAVLHVACPHKHAAPYAETSVFRFVLPPAPLVLGQAEDFSLDRKPGFFFIPTAFPPPDPPPRFRVLVSSYQSGLRL